jgi:hypothetical protein
MFAGENISARFVVPAVASSVDLVVHLGTGPDGTRRGGGGGQGAREGRERRDRDRAATSSGSTSGWSARRAIRFAVSVSSAEAVPPWVGPQEVRNRVGDGRTRSTSSKARRNVECEVAERLVLRCRPGRGQWLSWSRRASRRPTVPLTSASLSRPKSPIRNDEKSSPSPHMSGTPAAT